MGKLQGEARIVRGYYVDGLVGKTSSSGHKIGRQVDTYWQGLVV